MENGDILTVVGGLVIVIVIALVANPQYLSGIHSPLQPPVTPTPVATTVPVPQETLIPIIVATPEPVATPLPILPDAPPYRIYYNNDPFSYPRFKLPENMETFGASEIPLRNEELVTFAFVEDTRGDSPRSFPFPIRSGFSI